MLILFIELFDKLIKHSRSTGAVKNSYRYDPFGNSTSKTEAVSNPWQFASGYLDANTGLYKFGERYYDPQVGRWTQKDPVSGSLGSVNSTNPYVYADNVPNMLVDPSGRDVNPGVCAAAIAFAAPTAWQFFQALLRAGTFIIQGGIDVAETIPPFFELLLLA